MARAPGILQINLPGSNRDVPIENPGNGTVGAAIENLLPVASTQPQPRITYEVIKANSAEQLALELGVSGAALPAWARLGFNKTSAETHVVVKFYQVYYTATFKPQTGGIFFRKPKLDQLKQYTGPGNPPAYISSVDYGRMLVIIFNSSSSTADLEAAIKLKLGAAPVVVGAAARYEQILANSTIRVMIDGGRVDDAGAVLTASEFNTKVGNYIQGGVSVSRSQPGVPVLYRVNYISDNSLVQIGDVVRGTFIDCESTPIPDAQFQVSLDRIEFQRIPCKNLFGLFCPTLDLKFTFWAEAEKQYMIASPDGVYFSTDKANFAFNAKSELSVPSYNDSCFHLRGEFWERYLVQGVIPIFRPIDKVDIPICYYDDLWTNERERMLPREIQYNGMTLRLYYAVTRIGGGSNAMKKTD